MLFVHGLILLRSTDVEPLCQPSISGRIVESRQASPVPLSVSSLRNRFLHASHPRIHETWQDADARGSTTLCLGITSLEQEHGRGIHLSRVSRPPARRSRGNGPDPTGAIPHARIPGPFRRADPAYAARAVGLRRDGSGASSTPL